MSAQTSPSSAPSPYPLRQDAQVMGLVGLAHALSHFFHMVIPPLFPWLKEAFHLSYAELGFLMTVFFIVSTLVQAGAGFVVDAFGPRRVLFGGIAALGVSAAVLGMSQNYFMLCVGAAFAGLGNGVFHPADFTILNKQVSTQRLGYAFSTHGITGNLGWALAPVFLIGITQLSDWRTAYFAASALAFAILAGLMLFRARLQPLAVQESVAAAQAANTPATRTPPQGGSFDFLKLPQVWQCWGFFFLTTLSLAGIQHFAPTALTRMYNMSLALATTAYTFYMLCSAGGMLVGGFVAAKTKQHDRVVAAAFSCAGLLALVVAWGVLPASLIPVLFCLIGFGAGMAGPSRDLLVRTAAPAGATGRVYGVVYSGLDIGFAVGPLIYAAMMDGGRPALVFVGIATFQLLAIFTALTVGQGNRGRFALKAQ